MTISKNSPRIVAIVQARMGSSRLPLKSLLCLRDYPLADWVAKRLKMAKELDQVLFAIPDSPLDDTLADHLQRKGIGYIRGSENDVLDRFCKAAELAEADYIVRVCADNPLVAPEAIDALIKFFKKSLVDYAYNHIPRNNLWPDGLGAEMVSRKTLESIAAQARTAAQREHCFNYIWDNPKQWKIATFDPEESWLRRPDLKLDIDTAEDFRKMSLLPINPDMKLMELMRACGTMKIS